MTKGRAGFTLLELLIVIAIIGLLASIVAPKLIGRVGKSKTVIAKAQVESFTTALETYRLDTGEYPPQEQGLKALIEKPSNVQNWHGPYLRKKIIPDDPWGQPYIYRYPGKQGDYDILSYGADKREGGKGEDEDIVSWE
ncbi:MAG TPA: type II secretion system major pseudopilin GspG [Candidatus Hypogeohydataceae bacterium YC41]